MIFKIKRMSEIEKEWEYVDITTLEEFIKLVIDNHLIRISSTDDFNVKRLYIVDQFVED